MTRFLIVLAGLSVCGCQQVSLGVASFAAPGIHDSIVGGTSYTSACTETPQSIYCQRDTTPVE